MKSNGNDNHMAKCAAARSAPLFKKKIGIVCPTPTFGNTLAITVRSSVERQMSRQPMSQRGCLASIKSSARASTSLGPSAMRVRSAGVSGVSRCISAPLASVFGSRRKRSGDAFSAPRQSCARPRSRSMSVSRAGRPSRAGIAPASQVASALSAAPRALSSRSVVALTRPFPPSPRVSLTALFNADGTRAARKITSTSGNQYRGDGSNVGFFFSTSVQSRAPSSSSLAPVP